VFNDVADVTIALGLVLIGQIHSHGPGWPLDLSPTDRTYGPAFPWYLSVVAPNYGLRSGIQIQECGVHVFETGSGYRRLALEEIRDRIHVLPDRSVDTVTIGECS